MIIFMHRSWVVESQRGHKLGSLGKFMVRQGAAESIAEGKYSSSSNNNNVEKSEFDEMDR